MVRAKDIILFIFYNMIKKKTQKTKNKIPTIILNLFT